MKRNVSLNDISDGHRYGRNDLVKVGCNDCVGCFACCEGMGSSIILDPLDVHRLCTGLNCMFEQLINHQIELNVVDGLILPNLKMNEHSEKCSFLNAEGRCSIHSFRPGVCRLFPLGRIYEDGGFRYFLQVHECKKNNRSKIKVHKWIDTDNINSYEQYINDWHYFLKDMEVLITKDMEQQNSKAINMALLQNFYLKPYSMAEDFYSQFNDRMAEIKSRMV